MEPYMAEWLANLQADSAESHRLHNLEREAQAVKLLVTERARVKPLTEQIEALMNSLPPALRDRPWSMADMTSRLQGKYRDRPHPQNVGQALRILGWKQKRCWSQGYNGVRLWFTPSSKTVILKPSLFDW